MLKIILAASLKESPNGDIVMVNTATFLVKVMSGCKWIQNADVKGHADFGVSNWTVQLMHCPDWISKDAKHLHLAEGSWATDHA